MDNVASMDMLNFITKLIYFFGSTGLTLGLICLKTFFTLNGRIAKIEGVCEFVNK